jgi:DNA-binding response OmpR family regulator
VHETQWNRAECNLDHKKDEIIMTTVFCAEGNPTALRLQTSLFQMSGYAVLAANDPDTALELAKKNPFDVAIVDDQFAHSSGKYIAREIRRMKPNSRIVFLSSSARLGWEDSGEADEYVSEGEGFEVLLHKVQSLTGPALTHAASV